MHCAVVMVTLLFSTLQDQAPADKEDRAKWVWVKAQKWALHIAYRMFTRYANPPRCEPGNDMEFAKRFVVRYPFTLALWFCKSAH